MKRAVIYVRVSSKEQKNEGYSIPAQKKLLREYALQNEIKIVRAFEDDETAKKAGRTSFGEMVAYLKANKKIDCILVEKTDRLYRNFRDYVTIDELGITVFLVKENEEIGKDATSHQKFIHGIKVLMAKNFIDNLREETKKGLLQKAESGIFPSGNLTFGYYLPEGEEKAIPKVDEDFRDIITRLFEYYSTGRESLESVIEKLKEDGFSMNIIPKKGCKTRKITKSVVQRILRNVFYRGDFIWDGKTYKGIHEPLVSRELWGRVRERLDGHKKKLAGRYNTLDFTFKGIFKCGECGRGITAEKKIKPSGKEYIYYRCTKFGTKCSQKAINETNLDEQLMEKLEEISLPESTIELVRHDLKQNLVLKHNTEDKVKSNLMIEKKKYEGRLRAIYEDKIDGKIAEKFYNSRFEEYSEKIKKFDDKISKYTNADIEYYKLGAKILELLSNASTLYKKANPEEKNELVSFLLSNSILNDRKAFIQFKKPFSRVLCAAESLQRGD